MTITEMTNDELHQLIQRAAQVLVDRRMSEKDVCPCGCLLSDHRHAGIGICRHHGCEGPETEVDGNCDWPAYTELSPSYGHHPEDGCDAEIERLRQRVGELEAAEREGGLFDRIAAEVQRLRKLVRSLEEDQRIREARIEHLIAEVERLKAPTPCMRCNDGDLNGVMYCSCAKGQRNRMRDQEAALRSTGWKGDLPGTWGPDDPGAIQTEPR